MLARARAHRPLLAAALLTVLLTTAVLATLTAYSTTIGDASLRHALANPRDAAGTTLLVKAESLPEGGRTAADTAVRRAAERAYDGLPVTLRTLARSGPYGLPPSLRPADRRAGSEEPDLTHFAALDRTQVRLTEGRMPSARPAGPEIEVALPVVAARELGLRPGARFTLDNRLKGPAARVHVTGLYRPADTSAPYWQLDELAGRGIVTVHFTTYGPLLTDPAVLTGGRVSTGPVGWLASADFSGMTTGRIDALRTAMKEGVATLPSAPALHGSATVAGDLPATLDRVERALFVSRSTLLVVVLQLALLAGCALLLVARLLTADRAAETRLLRARGASRPRVARLAALEALLLAVPAALCAPLLAGPLTRLLAGRGALARIGLHLDASVTSVASQGTVWLVSVGVALGCALAVTLPALATPYAPGRAKPLPGAVRAGGDLGLLAVAGVAYWQLSRRPAGAVGEDLGVDPLLVAAPALALLAGTVLTLRLLPLPARLAELRASRSRGLSGALAGWQLARRPMRGAGPVLLLVLAVALGMLAVGQGSSWERSQDDQADFRAGTQVRVLSNGTEDPGRGAAYAAVPGVRSASPASRTTVSLSGGRQATVLALDTEGAAGTLLMRPDLADVPLRTALSGLAPKGAAAGVRIPAGTARLALSASLRGADDAATVTATVEDAHGTPYPLTFGELPQDGRPHDLVADLEAVAGGPAGPLTLTGFHLDLPQPVGPPERCRLALTALTATDTAGRDRALPLSARWRPSLDGDGPDTADGAASARPRMAAGAPATVDFTATPLPPDMAWLPTAALTLDLRVPQPPVPVVEGVATDRYLESTGARIGQRLSVQLGGGSVPVRIARAVRALPTTPSDGADDDGGALLLDLASVNRALQAAKGGAVLPNEWWLSTEPGASSQAAGALRQRPDIDPSRVVVRDEIAERLRDDPFGAGPGNAFAAAAFAAAALTAVGFAVSAAGSLRERSAEFGVLRALGASRRRLARVVLVEHAVLVGTALAVGVLLGAVLARAVIPLVMLTAEATRPLPGVLVVLPPLRVAALLAAVAAVPLVITAVLALRRVDAVSSLRDRGGE
ncbi:ABC transporter permease [Streptomyces althioticus]|uniref:ABC transporter permease n=3 Tax=Actinomycetes TaxID=1760 RepID=A0ABZ1YAV3_9ACTN|nr:ABC transporter permease [Streptomyces althioticus]WTB99092.1 ABC transporter permease [Streptomyces althioticus]